MSAQPKIKLKRCRQCQLFFRSTYSTLAKVCSPKCAILFARAEAKKKDRKETRAALVKLRTVSDWLKLAQARFNEYVRLRDAFFPCISCGTPAHHRVKWNAGHYRPVGNNTALRFDEANCHRQCEACNSYRSGNLGLYRPSLIARIGLAEVERLDESHEIKRWAIPELIGIRDLYRMKTKALKSQRAA